VSPGDIAEAAVADVVEDRPVGSDDVAHRSLVVRQQPADLRAVLLGEHVIEPGAVEEELVRGGRQDHRDVVAVVHELLGPRGRGAVAVGVDDAEDLPAEVVVAIRLAREQNAAGVARRHTTRLVALVVRVCVDRARRLFVRLTRLPSAS
jgi:hypothetical protein